MALQVIGRNTLPESTRGRAGTTTVAVRENGQIGFSTKAAESFNNFTHTIIEWDGESRKMTFTPVNTEKMPKGRKAEEAFKVGQSKNGDRYISAAELFKLDAIGYDYKTFGTHSFNANVENGKLSFTLPEEVDVKEKKPRKPRAAKAAAGANETAPATPELVEA
jgi:hypothetical protein